MRKIMRGSTPLLLALSLTACGSNDSNKAEQIAVKTEAKVVVAPTTIEGHWSAYLTDLTNNHIVPGYQNFAKSSAQLNQTARQFCALPAATTSDLQQVQQSWLQANLSWQAIQWVKVGPVVDNAFRIQYWPDNNKAVKRAIARHLQEPSTITAALIANKNVGGQGLPAAESLLYPANSQDGLLTSDNKAKRCELLTAISQNLTNISAQLVTQWQPSGGNYATTLITGSGEFNGAQDAVEELMSNWFEQIEKVSSTKTVAPLSKNAPGLAKVAENYLSDTSLASIKANIESFAAIYSAGNGHGLGTILSGFLNDPELDQAMQQQLVTSLSEIDQLQGSYTKALADETQREQLFEFAYTLLALRDLFSGEFIQATNLNTGFNSNDGD
ncbi:MAG: imelysin family protein [Gammaproteobacteria bacterium]|nr:imelysin family protein [Gammaproteobacteria bacterium]